MRTSVESGTMRPSAARTWTRPTSAGSIRSEGSACMSTR